MNAPLDTSTRPQPVKLTVEDFLLLKQRGAFVGYAKAELLDGVLWGVIRAPSPEEQWDDMVPILLIPPDFDTLRDNGRLIPYGTTKLVHGVICILPNAS